MQKNIFQIILLAVIVLFSSGCEDYLGGDTNIDPNKTNDASLNTLLPTILYYTAQSTASNASISSQYIQQIGSLVASGSDAQLRNTFDGQWSNLYLSILPNANIIIEKSTANNAPHYAGIAKIVIAYNLGLATATWENVPYSQADNQLTNLYPAYDTQESVYASAISLIDQGIQDLSATESLFKPGTDDIVYKGSTDKWIKLGYTLKARYLLHLASKGGNYSPSQVLDALANGMKSNSEDFQLVYTDRNFNPWYAVALANNTGNLTTTFGGFFMDLMNGTVQGVVDPRASLIAYKSGTDSIYHGTLAGAGSGANTAYNNKTSFFGWYNDLLSPLQMVTYSEAKFIEAEAEMMKNGGNANDAAYTAYLNGIKANLSKIGVSSSASDAFINDSHISVGSSNLTINQLINEKYKALFLNPEAWMDQRRHQYTTLQLPQNHNPDLNGLWIQRGAYPISETSRNTDEAAKNMKDLSAKMWIIN